MQSAGGVGSRVVGVLLTVTWGGLAAMPTAVTALEPATPAEEQVQKLTKFWVVDRFRLNHDENAVRLRPILEGSDTPLAKAPVDECFVGVGVPSQAPVGGSCPAGTTPKRNQAYVWSLTEAAGALWYGTVANTHCLVQDGFLGFTDPQQNSYWVCEFGASVPWETDWRPPRLYRSDLATGQVSPLDPPAGTQAHALLWATIGFRAAGNAGGVVFLAGPAFSGGITVFAFDADTAQLIGARLYEEYADIRTFVQDEHGNLYLGVGNAEAVNGNWGTILRWTGSKAAPFQFQPVGSIETEAANLALFQGRLFVTTWPSGGKVAGLFRSPAIPAGGLDGSHVNAWTKVWSVSDYDPDPIAAATTGGGAIAAYAGRLYWGTMHVPFVATQVALGSYGRVLDTSDPNVLLDVALGTHRSIAIFEGTKLTTTKPEIRLLYGEAYLPKFDAAEGLYTIAYDDEHWTGYAPVNGSSGVGNFFNAYTWAMAVYDGRLYVGTFDWSQLVRVLLFDERPTLMALPLPQKLLIEHIGPRIPLEGADLFRFGNPGDAAESLTGVGNFTNYGVRTLVADELNLYVGTANPMNLHPDGGFELLQLTKP